MINEENIKKFNDKAWRKKGMIKSTHPDNLPSKFIRWPRYYGYCWIQWSGKRLKAIFAPVPLNWLMRKIRDIYARVKFGKSGEYGEMVYAKSAGFREGIETAIAITDQFKTVEEIKNHLKNCL